MPFAPDQQQQIESALQLAEAEAELWNRRVQTFQSERRAWRGLVDRVVKSAAPQLAEGSELRAYLESSKSASDAEAQLMQLSMAKAQSQAAVLQEALRQADRPGLVVPGAGR